MTVSFTITTVGSTTADTVKLREIEKLCLKEITEYFGGNVFATSGGVS